MIQTERLAFRKYTFEDLPFLLTMTSDPDVMKYIGDGRPWSESETRERLTKFIGRYDTEGHSGLMLAIEKESQRPIGHTGLVYRAVEGKQELELGYWIARPHWGQGYAIEAARGWKEYAFHALGASRLVSIIQFGNEKSVKVAEKNGMAIERSVVYNGKEVALYSLEQG